MKKRIGIAVTVFILLLMMLQITHSIVMAEENKDFIVKEEVGKWEKKSATEMQTAKEKGMAKLVLEYTNADLESWQGNIQLSLSGEAGDKIYGSYIVEIPESNFSIEYRKVLYPGFFMGIGDKKSIELRIIYNGNILYSKNETATWPFFPRLDTRIYYSIWRRNLNTLGVIVQDYYGHIFDNLSVFWTGNITYIDKPQTLRIIVTKNSEKPSQLSSYLYYNDVVEGKKYETKLNAKILSIDTSIMFYTSIGFLLIALTANIFSKSLTKKVEKPPAEVKKPQKKKKRKK